MRYASTALLLLAGREITAEKTSNIRRNNRSLRSTKSDECSIIVVKKSLEAAFECEIDPSDADGETGVRRALKVSPQQMDELRAMLTRGEIVSGESVLVHDGASFDEEHLHVPSNLAMKNKVMGRAERRLARELFPDVGEGYTKKGGDEQESFIIEFANMTDAGPASKCDALVRGQGSVTHVYKKALNGCSVMLPAAAAKGLNENPNVALVEADGIAHKSQVAPGSWGLDRINQLYGTDGLATKLDATGVKVYIVDTGLKGTHEDFLNDAGGSFIDESCSKSFVEIDGSSDNKQLKDGDGHGTHVGSTTCGKTYGVATCDKLCAVRVLGDNGSGAFSWIINGIEFVMENCQENERCVFNASLGGGESFAMNDAVKNAVNDGVVAVVAAGNSNQNACNYSPASAEEAITVGSTTRPTTSDPGSDGVSGFSNYGSCVDVYAPGSYITAAWYTSDTATNTISGTSMASPHVAGIAAAVLKAAPWLDSTGVMDQIKNTWTAVDVDVRTGGVGIATTSAVDPNATPPPTPSPTSRPPCDGMDTEINVTTDDYFGETNWEITSACGTGYKYPANGPRTYSSTDTFSEYVCLPNGAYVFTINDTWGDGICCSFGQGSYDVEVDGTTYSGGNFGYTFSHDFGSCGPTPTPPPTTGNPTLNPTPSPTPNPTNPNPTPNPTPSPTPNPTSDDPLVIKQAEYAYNLGTLKCSGPAGSGCTSGNLHLDGKRGNNEVLPPNTVDACDDGSLGDYHFDESVDKIVIQTVDGSKLRAGKRVEFNATVWAYTAYYQGDYTDFYYAANAGNPNWQWLSSVQAPWAGGITWTGEYDLPNTDGLQAFRVVQRWMGNANGCGESSFDDTDDLAFNVAPAADGYSAEVKDPVVFPLGDGKSTPITAEVCGHLDDKRCGQTPLCMWDNGSCIVVE